MKSIFPLAAVALAAAPNFAHAECHAPLKRSIMVQSAIRRQTTAFTQGLVLADGVLFESTGIYGGESSINRINLRTGEVTRLLVTPEGAYGEGLAYFRGDLYQLTWQDRKVFVYDKQTLRLEKTLPLPLEEGWGITPFQETLALSDGTAKIRFVDPKTFGIVRSIEVHDTAGGTYTRLNELEEAEGKLYANVWHEDRILEIHPHTGCVLSVIDLSPLYRALGSRDRAQVERDPESVPNGIAYDSFSQSFYVTGKNWPLIFRIKLI